MKEPESEPGKIVQPALLTLEQAAEFDNIRDLQELVDTFATNARGAKALKTFHKRLLNDFMPYAFALDGDKFPGSALVSHKSKEQLTGLSAKQLQLEITNKENYSLWEVSDLESSIAKLTLKWGLRDLWDGMTVFQIDVTECEELVYILS